MGRARSEEKYAGMRARILAAAQGLVAGGQELTARKAAQAAGCAQSVLYHYFKGLGDLENALLDDAWQEIGQAVASAWREGDALRQNLSGAFHAALHQARQRPNEYRTYSLWSVRRGTQKPTPLQETLTRAVGAAMETGELKPGDPTQTAFLLWQGLQALNRTLADLPTDQGDALLDRYIEILFEGVRGI